MLLILQPLVATTRPGLGLELLDTVAVFAPGLLGWGWLLVLLLTLSLVWKLYRFIKLIDYLGQIRWCYLQVTLPDDAEVTPKSMENAIAVWAGIHKSPDMMERYFEGYIEAWYSLEVQCEPHRARYFLAIPEVHRQFFEGVVYGQYPMAEIREVEDYSLTFDYKKVREDFEVYGTDMILANDDVYPIRTYALYDDPLSPEDTFIDPHQALIEAYTNIRPGEQFWFQILVWPKDASGTGKKWVEKGEATIAKITGKEKKKAKGFFGAILSWFAGIPREALALLTTGELPAAAEEEKQQIRFFDPVETAKMEGILRKTEREAYHAMVRVVHIAPKGQLHKPNVGRAIGGFKQFNSYHLNGFRPDGKTKSNGVDYIMKERRRKFRERQILAFYQWRDPHSLNGPYMLTAEEIATLYHFPGRWVQAPVLERAKAGVYAAPDNVPYVTGGM